MKKFNPLTAALSFPIICLVLLAGYKAHKAAAGKEILLPISGYDPRDLLSGHYLTYRVEYNADGLCDKMKYHERKTIFLCVTKGKNNKIKSFVYDTIEDARDNDCDAVIKGECVGGSFTAGIEKFYIPEKQSGDLDKKIRGGGGKIFVSVDGKGKAVIKDLYVNDIPLRKFLNKK